MQTKKGTMLPLDFSLHPRYKTPNKGTMADDPKPAFRKSTYLWVPCDNMTDEQKVDTTDNPRG